LIARSHLWHERARRECMLQRWASNRATFGLREEYEGTRGISYARGLVRIKPVFARKSRGSREPMHRDELKSAILIATCVVVVGFLLTALSVLSMRMAYHRAYAEIASSCQRVSLLTVGSGKYLCAPVARVEGAQAMTPGAHPDGSAAVARL
jgi:hypothetical protein